MDGIAGSLGGDGWAFSQRTFISGDAREILTSMTFMFEAVQCSHSSFSSSTSLAFPKYLPHMSFPLALLLLSWDSSEDAA